MPYQTLPPAVASALQASIEATSLRRTARSAGVSPTCLSRMLNGGGVQDGTFGKVALWFASRRADTTGGLPREIVRAVINILLRDFPPPQRGAAAKAILDVVSRTAQEAGVPVPGWLREAG